MPDIITGKIFVDGEKGITANKLNQIQSLAVIQPDFLGTKPSASSVASSDQLLVLKTDNTYARAPFSTVSSSVAGLLPLADATQSGMLRQVSGNASDFVDGTNHCQALATGVALGGLRCFNAIGNSTFEVDQINVGNTVANASSGKVLDRWFINKVGSAVVSAGQNVAATGDICLPGTNFRLTRSFLRVTLTTVQATLAATDDLVLFQTPEGAQFRELQYDVHSVWLLVRSSVAGLKFGLTLTDPFTSTKSLSKVCTIPTANTWTAISLPNLPVWPAAGNFSPNPGAAGYVLMICLAAGTTYTAPANDTWQNGAYLGAVGQDSFVSKSIGSTFDIAYVSHVPGANSLQIDEPFLQNYDECLRYWQKSYPYKIAVGTTNTNSWSMFRSVVAVAAATNYIWGGHRFPKPMARAPTLTAYHHQTGAANSVYGYYATSGTIPTSTATFTINGSLANESVLSYLTAATGASPSELVFWVEWVADTFL